MIAACLVMLITGQTDLPHHHWQETTPLVMQAIREQTSCEVRTVEDARAVTPESLRGYHSVVLNYNGPRIGTQQEKAIESFVKNGGGLVAFHQALYGEWFGHRLNAKGQWEQGPGEGWREWSKMLGASWDPAKLGHTPRGAFEVRCVAQPVCAGAGFIANDELYYGFTLSRSITPVATALRAKGASSTDTVETVAWTNTYGKGRVFFTTLGHDATALFQHGTRDLLGRGVAWTTGSAAPQPRTKNSIRVLVVTSGHSYPEAFYTLWANMPGVEWRHATTHIEMERKRRDQFDVLVLHDMHERVTPAAQEWLKSWVESGKGVISLHHAVVNYTEWPWWWQEVTGGKFFTAPLGERRKSTYKEDVEFVVTPVRGRKSHPVLAGVPSLVVEDEMYKDMWQSPRIEVLMETDDPGNDRPVVYIGPAQTARVLYIQLGHSAGTFLNPGFRRLMQNAVEWTAGSAAAKPGGETK